MWTRLVDSNRIMIIEETRFTLGDTDWIYIQKPKSQVEDYFDDLAKRLDENNQDDQETNVRNETEEA